MPISQQTKSTLLIVDDEPSNIKLLINALGNINYHIRVATDGMKALEIIFGSQPPDLILLDIEMPETDGYQVCHEIKQHNKYQDIPIILIAEKDDTSDKEKGLLLGAVDYVSKPFHMPLLKARVKTHIELKLKSELLERHAAIDKLTNIPNQRNFLDTLSREWQRCQRTNDPLSVILIDIDHFKQFNDSYGHPAGDDCLKGIAKALSKCLRRPGDTIARYDGEEFAVVLPSTNGEGTLKIAQDLQSSIKDLNISHESSPVSDIVTLSIGIGTTIPATDIKPEQLVEHANKMLQSAKNSGKNQIKASETK